MSAVIQALVAAGFEADGQTHVEQVRIPTMNSPVLGGCGGELATFGGRQRFAKPGTDIKATVGARTTSLYRSNGTGMAGVSGIANVATKNIEAVMAALASLPA